MSASLITRSTLTDDDGTGLTGSIWTNAELQKVYDAVDLELSGTGSYGTLTLGGGLAVPAGFTSLGGYRETVSGVAIVSGGLTLDLALGSCFSFVFSANITSVTILHPPSASQLASFILEVVMPGTGPFTWAWLATVLWPGAVVPIPTVTLNYVDRFLIYTRSGGVTWSGAILGQGYQGV